MPQRLMDTLDNWPEGVITAVAEDQLPQGASPRGRNAAFLNIGAGQAKVGFRKGAPPAFATPLTGEPEIVKGFYFRRSDGGKQHLVFGKDGSLFERNPLDGTHTLINAHALHADQPRPGLAVANDFLFILNGEDAVKFDGTNLSAFGIEAPEAAPTVSAIAGGSNLPEGTYSVLISYYNAISSNESGRSPVAAPVAISAGQKLHVEWTAPADAQVTHVMVYLQWQEVGATFYKVIAGATPAPSAEFGGFPVATTAVDIDLSQTQWGALKLTAPEVNDRMPPPVGAKHPVLHQSRMFCHDDTAVYFTEVEDYENFNVFDRYEPVNPGDGDKVVTIHSVNDVLVIIKRFRTYVLTGKTPNDYSIIELSSVIGTDSADSVVSDPNGVTYWWDHTVGPVAWKLGSSPEGIGVPLIGPSIDPSVLNQNRYDLVVAGVDSHPLRQRVVFSVPQFGSARNNLLLPFNYQLMRWESEYWNPFDVASMWNADDAQGQTWLWMGGYSGRAYQWWNGSNDGVPASTPHAGKVVASTASTLQCSKLDETSPGWATDVLKDLYVYATDQAGIEVQRRRILSNTADTLTITPDWGLNPNSTFTWVVGGCDFQWDTPWIHGGAPFNKKRYEYLYLQVASPQTGVPVTVDIYTTYDLLNIIRDRSFVLTGAVVYDSAKYDKDRYASTVLQSKRWRVGATGNAWRGRIRALVPDVDLTLLKVQMRSILLNSNR